MKAMILAAGLGTRLKPLTDHKPKALVEIAGKPMLEWVILKLLASGIQEIVINIHHFPDQILNFLEDKKNFGIDIAISDETTELLDSGGAILKAASFFKKGESFLLQNVDVVTDLDISKLAAFHTQNQALATLAVRKRESSRYLLFDHRMQLKAWQNTQTGHYKGIVQTPDLILSPLAFSGISMITTDVFPLITESGAFPLIDLLLRLAPTQRVQGFRQEDGWWFDLGKESTLAVAASHLRAE